MFLVFMPAIILSENMVDLSASEPLRFSLVSSLVLVLTVDIVEGGGSG